MKRYIKNFMMAMMVGATVFGSSCTDSFEEVNTDPDSPTDVPTTNLLAYSLSVSYTHLTLPTILRV